MKIEVLPSASAVAEQAAIIFADAAVEASVARGRFNVALAGGSTPEALYRALAAPPHAERIDWLHAHIFFGDERCVPPDHPDSNYRQARANLLDRIPLPPQNVHRVQGELSPEEAARVYEHELVSNFGPDALPRFDLILLGMGEDGHTASLFPEMPALDETERWAVASEVPGYVRPNVPRVTLTFPVLDAARMVMFLVTGKNKAERVREALTEGDPTLPAARVRPARGALIWLVDEAAASLLAGR